MYCSQRRLLRRKLEFHVCTINKSAYTKKVWKLIQWSSSNIISFFLSFYSPFFYPSSFVHLDVTFFFHFFHYFFLSQLFLKIPFHPFFSLSLSVFSRYNHSLSGFKENCRQFNRMDYFVSSPPKNFKILHSFDNFFRRHELLRKYLHFHASFLSSYLFFYCIVPAQKLGFIILIGLLWEYRSCCLVEKWGKSIDQHPLKKEIIKAERKKREIEKEERTKERKKERKNKRKMLKIKTNWKRKKKTEKLKERKINNDKNNNVKRKKKNNLGQE